MRKGNCNWELDIRSNTPPEVLCAACGLEDWACVRGAELEEMRHLLCVVQLVGDGFAGYDGDVGILGVGFINEGDGGEVVGCGHDCEITSRLSVGDLEE